MKIAFYLLFILTGADCPFNANLYKALEKGHQVKAFNFKGNTRRCFFPERHSLSAGRSCDPCTK